MSRTTTRLAIIAFATAGMYWAAMASSHPATADPLTGTSPGVPCVEILQDMAASPASVPKAVQNGLFAPAQAPAPGPAAAPVDLAAAPVPPPRLLPWFPLLHPCRRPVPSRPARRLPRPPRSCPRLRRPRRLQPWTRSHPPL